MNRSHPPAINIRWNLPLKLAVVLVAIHVLKALTATVWPIPVQQAVVLRPFGYTEGLHWLAPLGHALIHADFAHVLFNSFFIVVFASVIRRETRLHESVWIATFLAGVVGGALGQWLWWPVESVVFGTDLAFQSAIGASGGASALFAGAVYLRGGWEKARVAGVMWLLFNLVYAVLSPEIAWAAHVAGFLAGLAVMTRVRV